MVSSTSDRTSRKGFKFTKGNKVDNIDSSSYDDDIDKSYGTENTKSSKRKSNSNSLSVGKKSKTKQLNSDRSTTSTIHKHHYPKSIYEISSNLSNSSPINVAHVDVICDLVTEIVNNENKSLKDYFESNEAKSIKGSKHIYDSMDNVMQNLLSYLRDTADDQLVFEPELSRKEIIKIQQLDQFKNLLEAHSKQLNGYESNLSLFAKEQDVWISNEYIGDKINHNLKEVTTNENNNIAEAAEEYFQLLQSIENQCDQIIASTESTKHVIIEARQIQDGLYDTFNKVRMDLVTNSKAPSDAKDILKQMPNLF